MRLQTIALSTGPVILTRDDIHHPTLSAKDDWTNAQDALDIAITNFAKAIRDHAPT